MVFCCCLVRVIDGVTVVVMAEGGSADVVGAADSESSMTFARARSPGQTFIMRSYGSK